MEHNEYNDLMKRIKCTDEFRSEMQKKLSSEPIAMESYEDSVSGTDIAPKRSWTRYAAMAAAFVLVCGSVGGAAYAFRQHDKNQPSHGISASTGPAAVTELTEVSDTTEVTTGATSATIMEAVPSSTILALFPDAHEFSKVQFRSGPTMVPQGKLLYGKKIRKYDVVDYDGLKNKIASIEWTECSEDEVMEKETFNDNELVISSGSYNILTLNIYADGYLNKGGKYYKPLNEADFSNVSNILTEHFVLDEGSALADMISSGLPKNLDADYTFSTPYETSSGKIVYDGEKNTMYMTGEGSMNNGEKSVEMIMKPDGGNYDTWKGAPTALKVYDTAGNHESSLVYSYSNGILEYQPSFHYVYLLKDIERDIVEGENNREVVDFTQSEENGNKVYSFRTLSMLETDGKYTITLDQNDHLISCEIYSNGSFAMSFKLENYKFDTEDFTMDDYSGLYDEIAKEAETDMNR